MKIHHQSHRTLLRRVVSPGLLVPLVLWHVLLPAIGIASDEQEGAARNSHILLNSVMSSAGAPGASENFVSNGSLAQSTPIGVGEANARVLYAGFWPYLRWVAWVTDMPLTEAFVNQLLQNFPNPFNPATKISFTVGQSSQVKLTIYNLRGERVRTLVDQTLPAGSHAAVWDGTDAADRTVASGVYYYRLQVGDFQSVKKMVLLK
jgi:hypothetical protein